MFELSNIALDISAVKVMQMLRQICLIISLYELDIARMDHATVSAQVTPQHKKAAAASNQQMALRHDVQVSFPLRQNRS